MRCHAYGDGTPMDSRRLERQPEQMLEWSDVDLAVRDAVRDFVDKEIRPHVDDLESGDMTPYPIIRKLFSTFGIDAMAQGVAGTATGQDARRLRCRTAPRRAECSAVEAIRRAWGSS